MKQHFHTTPFQELNQMTEDFTLVESTTPGELQHPMLRLYQSEVHNSLYLAKLGKGEPE